jgi:hypothetical protein
MAGNVPVLEAGFDYQWMYGWYRVLDLLDPAGPADSVAIEDPEAGQFDDVTIRPRIGTAHPAEFVQVKFHVEQSKWYSAASLVENKLLHKAWKTFGLLRQEFDHIELSLVTTWAWDPEDAVRIGDQRLSRAFIDGTVGGKAGETREEWRVELGSPDEADFESFLRVLRFRTSYDEKTELKKHISDRLRACGLRSDDDAIRTGTGQVRDWVMERKVRVTAADVEQAIERHGLRRPSPEPPSVMLYIHTIRQIPNETGTPYELDWRDAFEGTNRERGHLLLDPADWNGRLLPELEDLATRIESETTARLLRVRGLARLSPWFAVGFTFRETTGWKIETDQYGSFWRTDASPSDDEITPASEELPGDPGVGAVSIGVTGDPTPNVRAYLASVGDPAGKLISVQTPRHGKEAIRSAGDLVRLATVVKAELQGLLPRAKTLLVFYWGPASGAVFLGHHMNAVASAIQLHEEKDGEYIRSFLLG